MANVHALQLARAAKEHALTNASLAQIQNNPDLLQFALAEGKAAFGDNCAPCHGAGGQGAHGYPNLNDDVWLWGGTLADIQHTITVGVRSTSPDTRKSQMPAFGRDGIVKPEQVDDLTEYVVHLSGRAADPAAVKRATQLFARELRRLPWRRKARATASWARPTSPTMNGFMAPRARISTTRSGTAMAA